MEQKLVKVPFEVELAKKIANGEVDGRIVTDNGNVVRIVCFDMLDDKGRIIGLRKDDNYKEIALTFNDSGYCVQNPSRKLMLEIPEYMTFKDGDVLYARTGEFWYVFIYRNNNKDRTCIYAAIDESDTLWIEDNRITNNDDISELRLATEPEKQKLIDALKASSEPKAKEYLKRFFPNHSNSPKIRKEYEFKPFDKVLVRDEDNKKWVPAFFWTKNDEFIVIGGSRWNQCIPYQGNEHLLGTTDKLEYK